MNASGKLLGSLSGNKMKIKDENGKRIMRAHIVLLANGQLQPDGQSADHIEHEEVLNDSITNLRWATNPEQNFNQGAQIASTTFKTATGTLLPAHPKWGKSFKVTTDGLIKVNGSRDWTCGSENKSSGDHDVQIGRSNLKVHVLMVESILGRVLTDEEQVDHIDGDHSSSVLSNLAPLVGRDNVMKTSVKLVTRIASGKAVVFGGGILAAESVPGSDPSNVTKCLTGKRGSHNGYEWKDSSDEIIDLFFKKMDEVDTTEMVWPELADNSRYANLLLTLALYKEWEAKLLKYNLSLTR